MASDTWLVTPHLCTHGITSCLLRLPEATANVSAPVQSMRYDNAILPTFPPSEKTNPAFQQTFFGTLGAAVAIVFANFGASYGTAKSGVGVMAAGVLRPDAMVKSLTPIIMAGILAIYGLVMSIQIANSITTKPMPLSVAFIQFAAGLSTGLSSLAAGFSIGIVGDAGVRANAQQPKLFVGMTLILVFAEVLGLYGLIVGLLLFGNTKGAENMC